MASVVQPNAVLPDVALVGTSEIASVIGAGLVASLLVLALDTVLPLELATPETVELALLASAS